MNDLILEAKQLIQLTYDKDTEGYRRSPARPMLHLAGTVGLAPEVTLGSLFNLVETDPSLVDFLSRYCQFPIADFHQEARLPAGPDRFPLDYLEISRHLSIWPNDLHREPSLPWLERRVDLSGIGPGEDLSGRPVAQQHWSISMSPMFDLAHLPLRLNPICQITGYRDADDKLGPYQTSFTLLEVLAAVYEEISFHGRPVQRNDRRQELRKILDEIESHPERLTNFTVRQPNETR